MTIPKIYLKIKEKIFKNLLYLSKEFFLKLKKMLFFLSIYFIIFTNIQTSESKEKENNFIYNLNKLSFNYTNLIENNKSEIINLMNYNISQLNTYFDKNIIEPEDIYNFKKENSNFKISDSKIIDFSKRENSEKYFNNKNEKFLYLSSIEVKDNFQNIDLDRKIRILQSFTCRDNSSCSNHGICNLQNTDCICDYGYTTIQNKTEIERPKMCNYEQKTQLKAFLFELFLGFGAGHFYTERYQMAGLKLAAFIFGIFIICLFPITAKFLSEKIESDCLVLSVSCFYYLCSIGLAFWFIYDLVMFGMNRYLDGNEIALLSWTKNPK